MPANLTPEYRAAEEAFRKARDPRERLERLREMLRTIPKHKGTDHLQGDIKRRIKEMSEELERPARGGARGGPPLSIRPEGARQLALIGPPNAGKSSLHARLTGSGAHAAPYPFTTRYPEPGMMRYEDIYLQLVDLPAVAPEQPVSWLATALEPADGALLVVDLGEPRCIEQVAAVHALLRGCRVTLTDRWEPAGETARAGAEGDGDPFALRLSTLLLANKRIASPTRTPSCGRSSRSPGFAIPPWPSPRPPGRASGRSAPGSSPISASRASTPRRRAVRPTWIGRTPCAVARPSRTLPGSCTRTSRGRSGTRACGPRADSTDSTSAGPIRSPTAT